MRGLVFAALLLAPLGGCAVFQNQPLDADCRHTLSPEGRPLRFCESGDLVTVDNRPPDPPPPAEARLIDDPKFVTAMIAQLPPVEGPRRGRAAHLPKPAPPGYITISDSDFLALVKANALKRSETPDAGPPRPFGNGS